MKIFKFLLFSILTFNSLAQSKVDRIFKTDRSIIEGTVCEVASEMIKYSYPNETLLYQLETAKVTKIEFSSGRIQQFNAIEDPINTQAQHINKVKYPEQVINKNTIAVLFVPFLNTETYESSEEMSKFAQSAIYNELKENIAKISPLSIQDIRTTNRLLRQANINHTNIDDIPIEELQKILGVDHIISTKVSFVSRVEQETTSQSTVKDEKVSKDALLTTTVKFEEYFYHLVYFDLYKDNTKIYSKSRAPFFRSKDSWILAFSYILKQSPIYSNKKLKSLIK